MHIAIDLRPWCGRYKTGVGEYARGLLTALFDLDDKNQYTLFVSGRNIDVDSIPWQDFPHVRVVHMPVPNKLLHVALVIVGHPHLDTYITHKTGEKVDVWFSPNIGFISLSKKVKHITTLHDLSFLLYPEFFTKKQQLWHKIIRPKNQLTRANHIIVPSKNTKRDIIEQYHINEKKITVIYPGVSPINSIAKIKDLPAQYVLFIGTKEPRKNIAGLIEAYKKSNAYDMGYSLVIAGAPGWKCRLVRNMIQCTKGVVSYDYISEEEKWGMYEKASLFIFPSFYEGFGFPPLEAAVYGCPVIVSNRSSLPEIMGDAAYYVDPYNITDMATGISRMLTNASLRMKYAELGKKQVEKYTWEDMAKQLQTLLKNI